MNPVSLPAWLYPVILLTLVLIAGVAEYLHLIPPGTFSYLLAFAIGLIAPSPSFPHTTVVAPISTPQATINTNKTEVQEPR